MGGLRLIIFLGAVAILIVAGVFYQQLGLLIDAYRYPPPGRRIQAWSVRLHIDAMGEGSPPVVFEAGIAATSLSWRLVQPEIAKLTRTISYDRAGLGWSNGTWKARDIAAVVNELRALLDNFGVREPPVLVAHSYGALVALSYASRFPRDIAGVILVDPIAPSEWAEPSERNRKMLRRGIFLARLGGVLAMLGVVRFALSSLASGGRAMPKFLARVTSGRGGAKFTDRMVGQIRKLPVEVWPMVRSHWCDSKCFFAMARYLKALPQSSADVLRDTPLIRVPVTVLSSEFASPAEIADHKSLARLGEHSRFEVVKGSGHWIQLDRADAVIDAIRAILHR